MLSWSPGHDGFSPITKCYIRVRLLPGKNRSWTTGLWSSRCCVWWMQGQRSESEERRGDHDTADQRHSAAIPARSPGAAGCEALQCQRVLQQRGGSVPRHHVDPEQHHRGRCVSAVGHSGCFYSFYLFWFFFRLHTFCTVLNVSQFRWQCGEKECSEIAATCAARSKASSQKCQIHLISAFFPPWKVT